MSRHAPNSSPEHIHALRLRRMQQVLYVAHISYILLFLINIPQGDSVQLLILGTAAAATSLAYLPLRKRNIKLAAEIFILVLGICLSLVMWQGSGLHSSAMLAYPGTLMFCVITGNRRLFAYTYIAMIVFMIVVVIGTNYGWRSGSSTSYLILLEFIVVITAITYVVNMMASDLFSQLRELDIEVQRTHESHSKIQHIADHDILTGLPNRRLADERFQQALNQSVRANLHIALVYIDIDDFKTINDTFGHPAGDELLQKLSTSISSNLRRTDTLIRQGAMNFSCTWPMSAAGKKSPKSSRS